MPRKASATKRFCPCSVRELPLDAARVAATTAVSINPANAVSRRLRRVVAEELRPLAIAVLTSKYWGSGGVKLKVGFMEPTAAALIDKILLWMNKWGDTANVNFQYSANNPEVRISRGGGGYWSYLGTDILSIPKNQQTMNLQGFSLRNLPQGA